MFGGLIKGKLNEGFRNIYGFVFNGPGADAKSF
jgi:hypothetical protein